jgi:2-polyprenyl-3-methyl-5-hydroxy-6-metoxy-1,4-benzoquinol methylase
VPIAQNLVFPTREAAVNCAEGALDMRRCTACGFVWNDRFDPALLVYDTAYDNDQSFSPRFRDHLDEVANIVADRLGGAADVDVLEVGCGQGRFLSILANRLGERWRSAVGYDPVWKGDSSALPRGAEVRGEPFSAGSQRPGDPSPDAAIIRHVIEHVADPIMFLQSIRAALAEGTPLFVETPNVDWILRQGAFFDFYHEHCSLFTPHSLGVALARAGFTLDAEHVLFDGQYLLAVAVAGVAACETAKQGCFDDLGYASRRDRFLKALGAVIDQRRRDGRVALWGSASKGVTLCLMLSHVEGRIDCVIDINARKQGGFMPASGMPIVAAAEAHRRGVRSGVVVNPAYVEEIDRQCREAGLDFELIPIDAVVPAGGPGETSSVRDDAGAFALPMAKHG